MNNDLTTFDWDDEIENDGQEFVTLEDGDYDFTVSAFERGQYSGSEKIPACNMAIVTIKIDQDGRSAFIRNNFYLVSSCEWKISEFFRSIGMKKHGEKLRMKWGEIVGCTGRCHVNKEPGRNQDVFFNNVTKFHDPDESKPAKATSTKKAATSGDDEW